MKLENYVLGEIMHAGTEIRVCRGIHRPSGMQVVVKLPVSDLPKPQVLGRLVHEYHVLTGLAAVPGVPRPRALLQQSGTAVLVLESQGFRSLDHVLAEWGRLPVDAGLKVALRIARVLEGVHAAGIVHKDVKPRHVLLDEACEEVTLLDFGIASALPAEATAASIPEALEGTLAYISPEQTGRTARALDERTDLYSLGVTLFEMLSGRRPFAERDSLALVYAHLAKDPPPLDQVASEVPKPVAAIVAKLLAKDPDQRYQTARGAAEDLDQAWQQWRERGTVEPFPLGSKDFSPMLRLPQLLVGRQNELKELHASFARVAKGEVELVLVGGPSGIGKTALVRTVYREIAKAGRGLLIAGKHDQLAQSTPYAAIAEAFGALMRQWLASPEGVLTAWQNRIRHEVGDNARLIADVVPELGVVMGPLDPVPEVQGEQVLNRQKLTWLNFVRAVTTPNAPLVMFLDDMQWADSATRTILQTLLTDVEGRSLLVIAAHRDTETPPEHPLWELVEAVDKAGARVSRVSRLTVGPLSQAQVRAWTARAMETRATRVGPLARVLWQKTRGNPFFLEQLLLSVYRQKQVVRDRESGQWRWDQAQLEQADVTDNVVALLTAKVREMPEATQQLLGLAACTGHHFHLHDLERLSGWERSRVTGALWPALKEELVVPTDAAYRPAQALGDAGEGGLNASYRFLHDRVQQASYERIAPEHRVLAHLEIGRRLLAFYRSDGGTPRQLLEMVRHLNLGAERIETAEERKQLVWVNLEAARAAKVASSYRLMASLAEMGLSLLGARAHCDESVLWRELAQQRLEAAYLLREFDDAEARAQTLLAMPLPAAARLATQEIRVRSNQATGQYARGRQLGLEALAEQGISFPDTEEACHATFRQEAADHERWFEQNPDAFDRMPLDSSHEHLLIDALMVQTLLCAALCSRPMLAILAIARGVSEARRRSALTPVTPFMIGGFAQTLSATTGMYLRAACWVAPGVRAAVRVASPVLPECLCFQGFYTVYHRSADASAPVYEQAIASGLKIGSFQGTSWALSGELFFYRLWSGLPLGEVDAQQKARWGLVQRAGDAQARHYFELTESWCDVLMSPGGATRLLDREPLSRGSRPLLAEGDAIVTELARILEAHLFLVAGTFTRALERAREAEQFRPVVYGMAPVTDIPLWLALSAAKCLSGTTDPGQRATLRRDVEHGLERFRYFSGGCAENFLHKLRLIEAELARVQGKTDEAMAGYDEAILLARQGRCLHVEALAAQLCAEFHLEAGRSRIAALYLREARDAYTRWGALAVAAYLEAKHPALLKAPIQSVAERTAATTTTVHAAGSLQIDLSTAVRAAQALSSELDPERVVGRLMELVLENAGAQRGTLLLRKDAALSVVARLAVDATSGSYIKTGLSEPLGQSAEVAVLVVQYVARTTESVVLHDARAEARFATDPYLASHSVRSLLALPLTHRGNLVGVLYLEHRDVPCAFPPARVELLSVLASHAAIAVENALLYRDLRRERDFSAALVETVDALVVVLDRKGRIVRFNRACERVTGYCAAEVQGMPFGDLLLLPEESSAVRSVFERIGAADVPQRYETYWVAKDSSMPRIAWSTTALMDPSGEIEHIIATGVDVTEQRRAEAQRAKVYQQAQDAVRRRDEFLAIASHELRTPLTPLALQMGSIVRALREDPSSLPPARLLPKMISAGRQVERLLALVDDLLDLSRITAGRIGLHLEQVDLAAVARDVAARFGSQIAGAGCTLDLRAASPLSGRWDRARLDQIITNLLSNALKYGGGKPIELTLEGDELAARLVVRDHGIGIPSAQHARIFDRFERAVSDKHYGGFGFGLWIVKQILDALGGSIQVESTVGKGATFIVALPRCPGEMAGSTLSAASLAPIGSPKA